MHNATILLARAGDDFPLTFLFSLLIEALIGAFFLRGGVWLYNKFAGGANSPLAVPEPDYGRAFVVTLVTIGVLFAATFAVAYFRFGIAYDRMDKMAKLDLFTTVAIALPFGVFAQVAMIRGLFHTTMLRGALVSLCALPMVAVVGIGIGIVVYIFDATKIFQR